MKILVLVLDGVDPERLFGDERLANIRRLMDAGMFGPLAGIAPADDPSAWTSLATGQAPGAEGAMAVWDRLARAGWRTVVLALPPSSPALADMGPNSPPRPSPSSDPRPGLEATTWGRLEAARRVLRQGDWDFLFVLEDCPARLRGALRRQEGQAREPIRGFLRDLDNAVGGLLELLTEETTLLIATVPGAFLLAGPKVPALGAVGEAQARDIAPTLLTVGGLDIPDSMPGRPLVPGTDEPAPLASGYTEDEEALVHERLSGLGYL